MKNCTRRSLYLTLLAVLLIAMPRTMKAQVNCATFTVPGTPATLTPTSTFQLVTTQSNRYYEFAATAGCTYTFSHCQGGGSIPVGTDPSLVLTNQANVIQVFNDDGLSCSPGSEIVWTCPTTATYRIHHEKCCCSQAGTPHFATMAYKVECPCFAGVASAQDTSLCAGESADLALTGNSAGSGLQWQISQDGVNYNNISSATYTPYTYGPLVAGTYWFRSIVSCTGVNNTVGNDTTNFVKITVHALPTVIFPPQSSAACCNSAPFVLNTATPTGGAYSGTGVTNVGSIYTFTPNTVCNGTPTITYTYSDNFGCTNTATQPYTVNDTPAVTFPPLTPICYSSTIFPLNTATPPGGTYSGGSYVVGNNFIVSAPGTFPVCYDYSSGGCTSKVCNQQVINGTPLITFQNPPGPQCEDNVICAPLSAMPLGGTWTGTGVVNGTFCPTSTPGPGSYSPQYTVTDGNGCTNTANHPNIIVTAAPNVTPSLGFPTMCDNSNPLNLSANNYFTTTGGTYYGTGVTGTGPYTFNPTGMCTQSPSKIYYTLTNNGCTSLDSQYIYINCSPTITQVGTIPTLCLNSAAYNLAPHFTPAGGAFAGTYIIGGTQFNPTAVGNHNVTYTYLDVTTNCSKQVSFVVSVTASNVNLPPFNPEEYCQTEDTFLLSGGTPLGGVYTANCGACVVQYGSNYYFNPAVSGADTFMVYYTYNLGGCNDIDSSRIIIHPTPAINFPPLADVCKDGNIVVLLATPTGGTFTGTGVSYVNPNWLFNPASVAVGNYNITYNYTDVGTGCSSSTVQNIVVKPRTGAITLTNLTNPTTCGATNGSFRINGLAPNTLYTLYFDRNGLTQGPFIFTSTNLGTYTVTGLNAAFYDNVLVYLNGCPELNPPAQIQLVDPNAPPAPTAGSNSPLCQFSTLQLTASTSVTNPAWAWTGPNSFFSNQQNPAILNVGTAAGGTYNVTVTNSQGCTSTPTVVTVVVNPAPNLSVSSNSPVCAGNTLNLTAGSTTTGTTFQWTGPSSFFSPIANPSIPSVTTANQGWYHVVATAPNNCTRADSVLVNVGTVTPSVPTAGANSPVCSGSNLNLTATNSTSGATYVWSGPSGYTSTLQNPVRTNIQVVDSGDYAVYATLNGCASNTSIVHVSVIQSLNPDIFITADPDDTVCFGTNINFNSVIVDGGTAPIYQWYKNGIPVIGAIDSFWGSPYLTDLDTVYCVLTNATTCTSAANDTSNKIAVHMAPNTIPTLSLGSYPFAYVAGQPMTFYANALNAGTAPTYQWYLNGALIPGATGATYTSSTLTTTDILTVQVTSNAPCAIPDTASDNWNAIMNLSVSATGNIIKDMKLYPNPNTGTFVLSGSFSGMTGVKTADIEVVNAVGQVIYKDQALMNNGKIDKQIRIHDIASGVYIVRVNADGQTSQLRFVVNK